MTTLAPPPSPSDLATPTLRVLRRMWASMLSSYGERWIRSYGDSPERFENDRPTGELTDAGAVWARGLVGLSLKQLELGVSRVCMQQGGWVLTLPEFRELCLGIPSIARVRLVLRHKLEPTPDHAAFCRLVVVFLDTATWARSDVRDAERMLREAYDLAHEYRMALGELPAAPVASIAKEEPPRPTAASMETAQEHMARIAELLHMRETESNPADAPTQDGEA